MIMLVLVITGLIGNFIACNSFYDKHNQETGYYTLKRDYKPSFLK